jgi:hypothetical protein
MTETMRLGPRTAYFLAIFFLPQKSADLLPHNIFCCAFRSSLGLQQGERRERATGHGITLDVTVDERLGDVIGDECKIKQILLIQFNLRRNPAFPLN